MRPPLTVWLGDERVGVLTDVGAGSYSFQYGEGATRRLSSSLPVRPTALTWFECRPFFEGLLPEGRALASVANQLGVDPSDVVGLLAELGAECAGAVAVLPAGQVPGGPGGIEWLDEGRLVERIEMLPSFPLGRDADNRIRASLAGAQRKLVVVVESGAIGLPIPPTPSTHLLKPQWRPGPDDAQVDHLVANEAFCMRLAARAGCRVAEVEPRLIGSRWVLSVRRFDRQARAGQVVRLHQEDIAQALGKLPASKYEQDGGLSLADVATALRDAGVPPVEALPQLLDAIVVAAATGNADQHAKNLAVLYSDRPSMAPLYDLTSTIIYPDLSARSAFVVGGGLYIDQIDDSACVREAVRWGMPERQARRRVDDLVAALHAALPGVVSDAHEQGWHQPVVDQIAGLVTRWPERAREPA